MLRSGVSGLVISFAKRLNRILGRKGKVWGDRWHGRELASPREVRNALVYVFRNVAKHGTRIVGDDALDPLSSAPRFTRWSAPLTLALPQRRRPMARPLARAPGSSARAGTSATASSIHARPAAPAPDRDRDRDPHPDADP